MSDTIPQPVSNGCRKYVKSRIIINTFNTFNNVEIDEVSKILGVSIRWNQKHIDEIPHGEFNGKPRFFKGDIIKLLIR